jgi:hypothetical protein
MWPATEATATAGVMPMKIKSGVSRNPPPMPNMPETNPTAIPIARMRKMFTGISAIGKKICTGVRSAWVCLAALGQARVPALCLAKSRAGSDSES